MSGRQAGPDESRRRSYVVAGQMVAASPLAAGLYLVATPIGNLGDVTLRALATLAACDLIACEDTRVTGKLLQRYGIATPLTPYHDHNAASVRPRILQRLATGETVALVCDAGTPLVSDPGYKLVRATWAAGQTVTAVPGASAVLVALAAAGLPTDRFLFEGFLPAKPQARSARVAELACIPATILLFESGTRLAATLKDLVRGIGNREVAICRELTKLHEEIRRGDVADLASHYATGGETRGEFVIVIAPPKATVRATECIDDLLRATLAKSSVKDAVAAVAQATGQSRHDIYQRALVLKDHDAAD